MKPNFRERIAGMLKIIAIIACLFLNACMMVGPHYKEPKKLAARHWHKDKTVKETPIHDAHWWEVFHDPNLTFLINQGYQHNLSLQSTGVKVLQARAQLAQAVGSLYPQQQAAIGSLNYNRMGGSSLQTILPSNFYTALLGFSANWEIDFWGKYRRAILSNDAAFLASYAAYDNALVTLTADIATTYINIRTTEELIQVTKQNIEVQRLGLQLAKARYTEGQTSLLDVEQAQTELSETQASLPTLISNLQQQKDMLGVLLGTTPDQVDGLLIKKRKIPIAPSTVAVGIPKESLIRRPDIYQARMEAIAQFESIGAAKANLYPSLSLAGTFTFASNTISGNSLGQIFNWNNRSITAGPGLNWPILNYGQITNAVRAQDAVFQQALLNYANTVLKAQQEVQDAITQYIEAKKSEAYLVTANTAAIKSTQLAIIRYREGESDYTPVLDAERQQLRVQRSLTNAKGDIPKALVALYRALGGGWQIRNCNDIVPGAIKNQMAARTNWGSLLKQQNHEPAKTKKGRLKQIYLPNW
jgi:NodT family efflux transporter outer membrane factor (OMF) lipoprotein